MEIYIDSQRLDDQAVTGENLEQILAEIVASHLPGDRTVTEVLIDGRTYSEESPRDAVNMPSSGIGRLDIMTIPTADLARVMLDAGPGHLDALSEAAVKIAEMFRISDEAEANGQYLVFLQTLQDFFAFLSQVLEAMAVPLARLEVEGLSAMAMLKELSELLSEMSDRQDEQDWVLLADLLEYELAPLLGNWKSILARVKGAVH